MKLRRSSLRPRDSMLIGFVLAAMSFALPSEADIPLTPIGTTFNLPVGIDHHDPSNKVIVSVNYDPTNGGIPYNFELLAADGSHSQFSSVTGFDDEVKIACIRPSASQGGFTPGELFCGSGNGGDIVRISADGSSVQDPWVDLLGDVGHLRGGLFQDRYGAFGGDLIVVTTTGSAGKVWRVTSAGAATLLASISEHLEGVTTVPLDPARYGPWSGQILVGAENAVPPKVYAISPSGVVTSYELGIHPEDFDIIPGGENFYAVDHGNLRIVGASAGAFAGMEGDVLVTDAGEGNPTGGFYRVHWNGALFEVSKLAGAAGDHFEHVTFSPAGITPLLGASSGINKDLCNNSGGSADGLEIIVSGIYSQTTGHYDGPYGGTGPHQPNTTFPQFAVVPFGQNTILRWSGLTVPAGNYVHVGATVAGTMTILGVRWTNGGTPTACAYQVEAPGTHIVGGLVQLKNSFPACPSASTLYVTSFSVEWYGAQVPLSDMNPGASRSPLRVDPIPAVPIPIAPGDSVSVSIPDPPPSANYMLLVYQVSSSPLGGACVTTDFRQVALTLIETPPPSGINKDVCNNVGTTADGIEFLVKGVYAQTAGHYDGPYGGTGAHQPNTTFPVFQLIPAGANTIVRWSGTTVPPDNFVHVGVSLPGHPEILAIRWLSGATPLGCAQQIGVPGTHVRRGSLGFTNLFPACSPPVGLYVYSITLEWHASELPLALLNPGASRSPIQTTTLTDPPFPVPPGDSVSVVIPDPPVGARFLLVIYKVSKGPTADPCATADFVQIPVRLMEPALRSGLNKDVCNNTGVTVDGIEFVVAGTYASVVGQYPGPYNGPGPHGVNTTFPNFQIIPSGGNTIFRWSGNNVAPSNFCHVGIMVPGCATLLGVRWLTGTTAVACAAQVGAPGTHVAPGSIGFTSSLPSCAGAAGKVLSSIKFEWYANEVALANLNLATTRSPIRTDVSAETPLYIPAADSIRVMTPQPPSGARYLVVVYEVKNGATCSTTDFLQIPLAFLGTPLISGLNKDVCNTTGSTADGIEFVVAGSFTAPIGHYDGPYGGTGPHQANTTFPNFTVIPSGTNTLFRWSGLTVPPGNFCHVGLTLPSRPTLVGVRWLNGGTPIGCARQLRAPGTHVARGTMGFVNNFPACQNGVTLYATNIGIEWHATEVPLASLNPGVTRTPIRTDLIAAGPLACNSGDSIRIVVPSPPANARFMVLIYRVANSAGPDPQATTDFYEMAVEFVGDQASVGVEPSPEVPRRLELAVPFPNPSDAGVSLPFSLPRSARVLVNVYDLSGRVVRTTDLGLLQAGKHTATWDRTGLDGTPARSGVYFINVVVDGRRIGSRRVVILE